MRMWPYFLLDIGQAILSQSEEVPCNFTNVCTSSACKSHIPASCSRGHKVGVRIDCYGCVKELIGKLLFEP